MLEGFGLGRGRQGVDAINICSPFRKRWRRGRSCSMHRSSWSCRSNILGRTRLLRGACSWKHRRLEKAEESRPKNSHQLPHPLPLQLQHVPTLTSTNPPSHRRTNQRRPRQRSPTPSLLNTPNLLPPTRQSRRHALGNRRRLDIVRVRGFLQCLWTPERVVTGELGD